MAKFKIPKINSILYLGIFILILKTSFIQSKILPFTNRLDNVLTLLSVCCLSFSIMKKKYNVKIIFMYAFITLVSLFSVFKTKNFGFLITIIVCLAIRNQNFDKVMKFIYKFQLFYFVIHFIFSLMLSIFGNLNLVMVIDGVERYCFGFIHPNLFSIYLFNLIILWSWLNYDKIKVKHIILILFISIISVFFTKTRTSFLTTFIFCFLLFLSKYKEKTSKILNAIARFIIPICFILTMSCVKNFTIGNKFAISINDLLSGRIKLGAYALTNFGYSFLGQDISTHKVIWNSEWKLNSFTFDNLYTYLAVNQGFVWIIVLSILFYLLAKKGNSKVNIFIIIWALYGITEVHGLNGFNCFPIFLVALLFEKNTNLRRNKYVKLR